MKARLFDWGVICKLIVMILVSTFMHFGCVMDAYAAKKVKKAVSAAPWATVPVSPVSPLERVPEPVHVPNTSDLPPMPFTYDNFQKIQDVSGKLFLKHGSISIVNEKTGKYLFSIWKRAFYECGYNFDKTIIKLAKDLERKQSLKKEEGYGKLVILISAFVKHELNLAKYFSTEVLASINSINHIHCSKTPPGLIDRYSFLNFSLNTDDISRVDLSPDHKYLLVTYSGYNGIFIYDLNTRKKNQLCENKKVIDLAFSPDRQYIATAQADNVVNICKVGTWDNVVTLKHENDVNYVNFSPDGKYLATASMDNNVLIYDTSTWNVLHTIKHSKKINTVNFNDTSDLFVTACEDQFARVFNVVSGVEVNKINHKNNLNFAYYFKNSSLLITGGGGFVRVFNTDNWQEIIERDNASSMRTSPDSRFLLLGDNNGGYRYFTDFKESEIPFQTGNKVIKLVFSQDGRTLATDAQNSPVRFFDAKNWKYITKINENMKYFDNSWFIGGGDRSLNLYDSTLLTLFFLKTDLEEFGFHEVARALTVETQVITDDYESKLKNIEDERIEEYSELQKQSIKKDEFESQKEHEQRLSERETDKWTAEYSFKEQHLVLKLETLWKRKSLIDKYEKMITALLSTNRRKVMELKAYLGNYSVEAESFPIAIHALSVRSNDPVQAVEPFKGVILINRDLARSFKENIEKYGITAELQKTRTGGRKLVNIVVTSANGKERYEFAKQEELASVNMDEVNAVLANAKIAGRTVLDMGTDSDFKDKGLKLLEKAKSAARIPGREEESLKWRSVATEYLSESFVNDTFPQKKNYQSGVYTFHLKAGEQLDHWIEWNGTYWSSAKVGESFERVYADGKVYKMDESANNGGNFKFRAITDCTITFTLK